MDELLRLDGVESVAHQRRLAAALHARLVLLFQIDPPSGRNQKVNFNRFPIDASIDREVEREKQMDTLINRQRQRERKREDVSTD